LSLPSGAPVLYRGNKRRVPLLLSFVLDLYTRRVRSDAGVTGIKRSKLNAANNGGIGEESGDKKQRLPPCFTL
jgi:hypothetical protein